MGDVAEQASATELLDLHNGALVSVFRKLDLQSLMMVRSSTKRLKDVVDDDLVWMELCQAWENLVNLKTWRALMDSGQALYRLLRTLHNLAGFWSHRSVNPRGMLLYVRFVLGGLEGWQIIPGAKAADEEVKSQKIFELLGKPDGSYEVVFIFARQTSEEPLRLPADIIIQRAQSPYSFVLVCDDVEDMQSTRNSRQTQSLGASSRLVNQMKTWRKLYTRLVIEEPKPGQELAGLWTGLYGSHGWEILTISYIEDLIVATKVTGDPNVPAGEVTFRAAIAPKRYIATGTRHEEMMYFFGGEGRIAQVNFVNPEWVSGLLVVEGNDDFSFEWLATNFIIGFKRLDVEGSFRKTIKGR